MGKLLQRHLKEKLAANNQTNRRLRYLKPFDSGGCLSLSRGGIHVPLFLHIFSETTWLIKSKFYVKPAGKEGIFFYKNGLGQMTKMAAMLIHVYSKIL